jgi:hypothetical protein
MQSGAKHHNWLTCRTLVETLHIYAGQLKARASRYVAMIQHLPPSWRLLTITPPKSRVLPSNRHRNLPSLSKMSIPDTIPKDEPAMAVPKGESSNFENPPNQNALSYAGIGLALSFTALFCGLRLYSRLLTIRKLQLEDCRSPGAVHDGEH